jgi:SPP1 gp7 family putative phage head morphogenesis protein
MLSYTFQVPEVILGKGSIPEGLAKVQMETFMMRIQSIQADMAEVIISKIIDKLLLANGINCDIKMVWGQPNNDKQNAQINQLTSLVGKFGSAMDTMVENRIIDLMGFDSEEFAKLKEQEKSDRDQMRQDAFAQQGMAPPVPNKQSFGKGVYAKVCSHCVHETLNNIDIMNQEEMTMEKWLGFKYAAVKSWILNAVARDPFKDLKANTAEELAQGYLTRQQLSKLRTVYLQAFDEGKSINWIDKQIKEQNIIPALLQKNEEGQYVTQLASDVRSYVVARTESTRLAFLGNKDYYKASGVSEVTWIASTDEKTCEDCEALDGTTMTLEDVKQPLHVLCRCTTGSAMGLK